MNYDRRGISVSASRYTTDDQNKKIENGSCLKTGQHSIFVIIYLLLPIKYLFFDSVSKILFKFFMHESRR